jgi:hypothetical protein
MNWTHIDIEQPEEDRDLYYFFPFLGVYRGKYSRTTYPEEFVGETEEPVYGNCFYGSRGFLTDDVTHWMYANGEEEGYLPAVPVGFIKIGDGKFREYALKEDTVRITKHEYETLKDSLAYLEAGHKTGLVCQEGCPCHIYWCEEYEGEGGYVCGCCGKVYDTLEVEINTYRYMSKYDRPCPNCNPHEENTKEHYQNGFLEYTEPNEPYSGEHYTCNKCDSTYGIDQI